MQNQASLLHSFSFFFIHIHYLTYYRCIVLTEGSGGTDDAQNSPVLQLKDPLAVLLVSLLVLGHGEPVTAGKLRHALLTRLGLLRGHCAHHVYHLPPRQLLDLIWRME